MPPASPPQLPDRYRVRRHLASGGMAAVWEVEDLLLQRVVAVKVLGAHYAAEPQARARFAREARMSARVCDHPHIATIYDVGDHRDDAFLVMELLTGGTVADRLRAARDGGAPVAQATALRWLREAAAALDVAHAAGIVHRDVKPANLLLDAHDRLAVGDFGIARLADDTQMTQTGQVLGTAAYLSPEQALGAPATAASDRYALAVVAFELLTGQRPFGASTPAAQLRQHADQPPPRASLTAPQLPAAVDAVLARGLAKAPGDRPPTATALVAALDQALGGGGPTQPARRLAPEPTRRHAPLAAAARSPERIAATAPARASRSTSPRSLAATGLVALLLGAAVAAALRGSDGDERAAGRDATATATASPPPPPPPSATAAAPAPPPTATPPAAADPAQLNDDGFALIRDGAFAAAVAPLRAAVQGFRDAGRTDELAYAYALFNLGVALNRSGDHAGAVAVLRERLEYRNQRGTVRRELRDALARLAGAPASDSGAGAGTGADRGGEDDDD